ncbi:winged helix-turn-helix domain-containing protein [Streptomyces narbonensis]
MTDAERTTRERLRLQAVERFEGGQKNAEIAVALRISVRSVERWRRAWREGGETGVLSKGSPGRPRLSEAQVARLEQELERGPLAHGWADQRWTLARIKTLIGRLFHVSYTVEGTWRLLKRHGWSWQQPTRRAIERDDDAHDDLPAEIAADALTTYADSTGAAFGHVIGFVGEFQVLAQILGNRRAAAPGCSTVSGGVV